MYEAQRRGWSMKWVTWERVGVDRMGCIWLIMRFIDPEAEFTFISTSQTAFPEGHEPFDIPGVRLTHRRGHCTFHTLLREYQLDDPVLERIASIIDEADIAQDITLEPAAMGLDMICQGLRLISPDDYTAIAHGRLIYEALYAQLSSEKRSS
jgi:hypothetical protein